ncbi:uncharacterized protein TM35_000074210 [Trypanosoma theileri]|uniref:Uncharacterized protein n=1 Tax=Trypanosoma theileri TaxID=67003 RepID=A0A1X0P245_9TRYP|nr:uncharacterized protein TM35_000074210 [Trypanosoma theileri]ORC90997.1 hypothetical protein TM35_000074210 [Trypanosoma theileri]
MRRFTLHRFISVAFALRSSISSISSGSNHDKSSGSGIDNSSVSNSDSLLDDIFSELSTCDITQRQSSLKTQTVSSSKGIHNSNSNNNSGTGVSTSVNTAAPEDAEIRAELAKQEHLQRLLQETHDQTAMTKREEVKAEEVRRHSRYVASPPAGLHLSTAELIQEKSPQHFSPAEDSSTRLSSLPQLNTPGSVAVVTLVGKVLSEATMHGNGNLEETDNTSAAENGPHARMLVQYSVPFLPTPTPVTVQVRCYGATLASFVQQHVRMGDLVHVLGHVLPLHVQAAGDPAFCVCALPVGGNISVVFSAESVSAQ